MNHDGELQYTGYTAEELAEAWTSIDATAWPLNHANLRREFEARGLRLPGSAVDAPPAEPPKPPSRSAVVGSLVLCGWFLLVGADGLAKGNLRFHWRGREIYAGDEAKVFLAFVAFAFVLNVVMLVGLRRGDARGLRWYHGAKWVAGAALAIMLAWMMFH